MHKFIFDVDGTLTPSRGKIDDDFKKFFVEFCNIFKFNHFLNNLLVLFLMHQDGYEKNVH